MTNESPAWIKQVRRKELSDTTSPTTHLVSKSPTSPPDQPNSQLPAHAAGARRRRNVSRDGDGPERAVPAHDGRPQGDALGACPHGVRRILNVCAADELARAREHRRPDPEPAVRAVCRLLGRRRALSELCELFRREPVCRAGRGRLGGVVSRNALWGFH
ncbi:hypothetical protein FDECE_12138 [Fusarium decemcellulare]|nr:hypothetical protein FDECE_12138 [Fusarium decemcellulare]